MTGEVTIFSNRRSLSLHALCDASVIFGKIRVSSQTPWPLYYTGFRPPVRSSRVCCRRPLGRRILRGNVTIVGKPGLWNAVARFSDGKYVYMPRTAFLCEAAVSRGGCRKAAASDRNLPRHDKIKCGI